MQAWPCLTLPIAVLCCCLCLAASLEAKHAGIGLSVFQSISTIVGGFAGPYLFGTVLSQQQDFTQATVLMGCFLGSSGLLAAGLGTAEQWQRCRSRTAARGIAPSA
jgi:multidrug transporter EmrE-like cation transporter